MGCVGNPAVKVQVGLQQLFRAGGTFHALVGFMDRCHIFCSCMLGCERCHGGLDNTAHGGQQAKKFILGRGLQQPVQHIRVEHVPLAAWFDHGTHPRPGVHQAFGNQHPGGFAQYRAADRIFGAEQGFGRQFVIGFEAPGDNLQAEFLNDARVHAFAVGGLTIIHGAQVDPFG